MAEGVLLGIPDGYLTVDEDFAVGWSVNKFGGVPNWMQKCLPSCHPRCNICNCLMYHVTQIYCPLEWSDWHRTLNVFSCLMKECASKPGSWRVLRSQCITNEDTSVKQQTQKHADFVEETWCADADDWGSDDGNDMNAISMTFGELRVEEVKESHTEDRNEAGETKTDGNEDRDDQAIGGEDVPKFAPMFIHVLEEPSSAIEDSCQYEKSLLKAYEEREGPVSEFEGAKKAGEKYEKTSIADGDRAFHKFLKRVRRCQEQCLRYHWNGRPILLSEKTSTSHSMDNIPVCLNCGSERVFEMQLMPALASILIKQELKRNKNKDAHKMVASEVKDKEDHARMDFGSVYIYTCRKSCSKTEGVYIAPAEEYVILHRCPDSDLLDNKLS